MPKKRAIYEINDLKLDNYNLLLNEALFHNANGDIGIRSVFEEGYPAGYMSVRGQYINGFYDFSKINQAERLYGLVEEKQTMVNIADTQTINLFIEGETFSMFTGTVLQSKRWLDMNRGITGRQVVWRSPLGKEAEITIVRMASLSQLSLFTIEYKIMPVNFSGEIIFESHHDGNVLNYGDLYDPRTAPEYAQYISPISCEIRLGVSYITSETSKSGLQVCSGVKNVLFSGPNERQFLIDNNNAVYHITADAVQGETVKMVKYSVFCDSIRYANCRMNAAEEMETAVSIPLKEHYKKQKEYLDDYWDNCHVNITGDPDLDIAMRFNLYQLNQSVSKDPFGNISPKGLSGEGYEGQYFWDTEMFIMPYFIITNPSIAKNLIGYRHATLDMARENAKKMGHAKGALYPWRTIMGRECSGYFPAGSAQYHINGDIAYAIIAYYLATKDLAFIEEKGAEILFETARLWMDVGKFNRGKFHINEVTGPDEYTCLVNNNYYTNVLAQYHLDWAVKFYYLLRDSVGFCCQMIERIALSEREVKEFGRARDNMYLPYDKQLDINPQDDSFLKKCFLDLNTVPKENHPMLLHYHPLFLYRHQVCKQADTVMAHFILEDAQAPSTIKNSYDYYEKITTHDSSLSTCMFGIMAAKLGLEEKAISYFGNSAKLDLMDMHKNTKDGIHTANMGGNYMAIVYGFGGFRLKESGIFFAPMLPGEWSGYQFKVSYEDSRLIVKVGKTECEFTLEYGRPKKITVYGKSYELKDKLVVKRPRMKGKGSLTSEKKV
jgi:alpha,alpha-trehalose phosphorylase